MADQTAVDDDNDNTLVEPLPLADEGAVPGARFYQTQGINPVLPHTAMPAVTEANDAADGEDAKDDPLSGEWTVR